MARSRAPSWPKCSSTRCVLGTLSLDDLKRYQPKEREALCFDHATSTRALRICGFPPPSSGAVAVGQIMGLLARTPQGAQPLNGVPKADWLHSYMEASRLAFADRAQYLADPDFVAPPAGHWNSLLAPRYLDDRAKLIAPTRAPQVNPGQPGGVTSAWARMPDQPELRHQPHQHRGPFRATPWP